MKRLLTFFMTLMLVVFTSTAFAQGGPKRVVQTNPDFTATGNYAKGDIATLAGVKCEVLSDNMVTNWSFENGLTGWTIASDFSTELSEPNFEQHDNNPKSGLYYLVGTQGAGAKDAKSLGTAWQVTPGKTYYFSYQIKALTNDDDNASWMKVSLAEDANSLGTEPDVDDTDNEAWIVNGVNPVSTDWQKVEALFTVPAGYTYLQVHFRWLGSLWGFDDFELYEVDEFADIDPEYQTGDEVTVDGITYTLTSDNLIDNRSFELGLDNWYSANNPTDGGDYLGHPLITSQYFDLVRNGDVDENGDQKYGGITTDSGKRYLVGTGNTGADGVASLYNAWEIEPGQTYYFSFDIRSLVTDNPDGQYIVTSLVNSTNTAADENNKRPEDYGRVVDSGDGKSTPNDAWKTVQVPFTNEEGYKYLQIDFRWLGEFAFDNFQLYKADPGVVILTAHEDKFEASSGAGTDKAVPTAECYDEFDHWSTTGTTELGLNTWSTEADPSGMLDPFAQAWVWSGDEKQPTLEAATISHKTIVGLPAGVYDVSMDIRIFSEAGNAIGTGTTFSANGVSEDLATGADANPVAFGTSVEVYGNYKLACTVGEEGTLDISINIPSGVSYNWISWKNLKVEYADTSVPVVEELTDAMNATVAADMAAAVEAYNEWDGETSTGTRSDAFNAAIDALQDAAASAAQYAELTAALKDINLDEAGQTVWANTETSEAYAAGTLSTSDEAQVVADIVKAVLAQVTPGSDMTYAMVNSGTWYKNAYNSTSKTWSISTDVGNYGTDGAKEAYAGDGVDFPVTDGERFTNTLYNTVDGLTAGIYEVSFYAVASAAQWGDGGVTYGDGIAQVFVNDVSEDITVIEQKSCTPSDHLYTLQGVVGDDGTLTFGIRNIAEGGNWDVAQEVSLTLLSNQDTDSEYTTGDIIVVDGVEYQVASENLVDNHSFEQGVIGWWSTEVDDNDEYFTQEISDENFAFVNDGTAPDGDFYIVGLEEGGKESPLSLGNYWNLDRHTNYYFSFYVKAMTSNVDAGYMKVSMTNKLGTETEMIIDGVNPVEGDENGWMKVETVFRNPDYAYLQMMFRWLADEDGNALWGLDNFQLYALTAPQTIELVAHEEDFADNDAADEALGHWTTTGNNGVLRVNTWSVEADASGMKTPFLENYVWEGTDASVTLTTATISHKQLVGLPAGDYEVSMDIRMFNYAGTAIGTGTTFNANGVSEDLDNTEIDGHEDVYENHTEIYGTYTLTCEVDETGTLDISIQLPEEPNYSWISWKNLKVVMLVEPTEDGDYMPELVAVDGPMNATVEAAMDAAIAAYETAQDSDTFNAAIDAIQDAAASAEIYAEIEALVDALDETGTAVWDETDSAAALADGSLETLDEIEEDMTAAQAAQTTAVTDWTYVVKNTGEWKHDELSSVINFQICPSLTTAHEAWRSTTFGGSEEEPSMPLYKEIADLPAGTYTISFYAYAAQGAEGDVVVFANDATSTIEVDTLSVGPNWSDEAELITLTCEVGEDGILDFGLKCIGAGAWYVAEEATLTFVEAYVEPIYDDDYAIDDEVEVDGDTYKILSENLFVNGGFNEKVTDVVPGWTAGNTYTDPLLAENVIITAEGGYNGGGFLTLPESVGAASEHTPTQAIAVTAGSTYLFVGYTSGTEPTDANKRYSALFAMQSANEEAHIVEGETTYGEDIITLEWGDPDEETGWTKTIGVFTATTDYVGMRMNWSLGSYDGLQLYEVESPQVVPGDYLVMVDGNYLAGGLNWGTKGMEGGKPQFIGFEQADNGLYTLDSYQSNGGDSHYLGIVVSDEGEEEVYFDTTGATWMVLKNDDGTVNIGNVAIDEETGEPDMTVAIGWLKTRGFQNAVELVAGRENATNWTLVKKSQILASMEEATADEPVDVTALIPAAEPKRNAWGDAWTMTAYDGESTIANGALGQGINVASVAESYHSSNGFLFTQIIPDLPVGTYKLTAQAFYRNDGGEEFEPVIPVMYAGDETAELPELPTELTEEEIAAGITIPNDMVNAYQAFLLEEYPVELEFTVAKEGDVEIGFSSELDTDNQLWTIFGELSLYYLGGDVTVEPEPEIEPGTVVHECVAEIDHWTIAGNTAGLFQYNTWSIETDESGMVTPFIEYWIGSGSILPDATISHETLTDLEPGAYEVSIFARAFNENSLTEVSEGITFAANGVGVDLTTGTTAVYDGVSAEVYGTYTVQCMVGEDGTLEIGFDIAGLTACDWVAFKNLTVTYIGEAEPEPEGTYEFVAEDWVASDNDRAPQSSITYNSDGTITVEASGTNNIALGNNTSASWYPAPEPDVITTAEYTITADQIYFTVIGSNLSTDVGDSYMWWMNGWNEGSQIVPTYTYSLVDAEETMYVWDISAYVEVGEDGLITLDGGTCFGLTSLSTQSTISDINFYTADDIDAIVTANSGILTEIDSVDTEKVAEGIYTLSGVRISKITKSGIYIVDGKKVLVK